MCGSLVGLRRCVAHNSFCIGMAVVVVRLVSLATLQGVLLGQRPQPGSFGGDTYGELRSADRRKKRFSFVLLKVWTHSSFHSSRFVELWAWTMPTVPAGRISV